MSKINYTSSGMPTNTITKNGWTCKPSSGGSSGTCSKNDNSSSFNYVCSGRKVDRTWSRCEVDTPIVESKNEPGVASYYSSDSSKTFGQSFTYKPFVPPISSGSLGSSINGSSSGTSPNIQGQNVLTEMLKQSPRKLSPESQEKRKITEEITKINMRLRNRLFDGISPISEDKTIEELKSILGQKRSLLDKHRIKEQEVQKKIGSKITRKQEKKSLEEQERSKTIREIIDINSHLRNKETLDGVEPTAKDRSLEELKGILKQKRSLLDRQRSKELEEAKIKAKEYSAKQQENIREQKIFEKEEHDRIFGRKQAGPLSVPITDYRLGDRISGYNRIKEESEKFFRGPVGIRGNIFQHDRQEVTLESYFKNSRVRKLFSSMEKEKKLHNKPTLDSQLNKLINKFIQSNPKHKKLLASTDRFILKEALVKAAQNSQKQDKTGIHFLNELLGVSSAKANPIGIAVVAEEIIALGGTTLVSAIVANKAIEDMVKYQELEDVFSKPQVLSTPVQKKHKSTLFTPDDSNKILKWGQLPGYMPDIKDFGTLQESFPIHQQSWRDLVLFNKNNVSEKYQIDKWEVKDPSVKDAPSVWQHGKFGKIYQDPEQTIGNKEIWWAKDTAKHGGGSEGLTPSTYKLYIKDKKKFQWIADVDATGKVIENKTKSEEGRIIPVKQCWKVK